MFNIPDDKGCALAFVNPASYSLYTIFLNVGLFLKYNKTHT